MGLTFRLGQVPLAIFTDSSNNVGIGAAANASYKLQVTGTTNLTGALSGTSATFSSSVTATSESSLFKEGFIVKATTTGGGGSQPAYTYYTAAGSKRWSSFLNVGDDKFHIANASNSEVFTITQSGNVGIGTTTPSYALSVRKDTNDWIGQFKNNGSAAYGLQIDLSSSTGGTGGYAIGVYTQTGTGFFVKNDGNVGIGTSSPGQLLHLYKSSGTITIATQIGGNYGYIVNDASYISLASNAGATGIKLKVSLSAPDDVMTITSGGEVLINRTSSANSVFKLQVEGRTLINSNQYALLLTTNSGTSGMYLGCDTGSSNTNLLFTSGTSGGSLAYINGVSGAYVAVSDENKKKNIELYNGNAIESILLLKPKYFNMKADEDSVEKQLGFIAQDVKDVIPEAYCELGEFIGLQDRPIIAVLVKAVQELSAKVTALENQ